MGTISFCLKTMAAPVKVLDNALGQHLIAGVQQVENSETQEVLAYWLTEPRSINYSVDQESGSVSIRFLEPLAVGADRSYSVSAGHIVTIVSPKEDVLKAYNDLVYPEAEAPAETAVVEEAPAEGADEATVEVEG